MKKEILLIITVLITAWFVLNYLSASLLKKSLDCKPNYLNGSCAMIIRVPLSETDKRKMQEIRLDTDNGEKGWDRCYEREDKAYVCEMKNTTGENLYIEGISTN